MTEEAVRVAQESTRRKMRAHVVIERMRHYRSVLTITEFKYLRQMVLDGENEEADRKLSEILKQRKM